MIDFAYFGITVLYQAVSKVTAYLLDKGGDGIVGNRADDVAKWAVKKGWTALKELRTSDPNLNHDLQRALRKSYLLATLELVRQADDRLEVQGASTRLLTSDMKELVRVAGKAIEAELNGLEKALPRADPGDADLLVLDESTAPRARWETMRANQRELLRQDVARWTGTTMWPIVFDELLDEGWQIQLDSSETIQRDWHTLISIAFIEELKSETRVRSVFESRILAELKNREPQLAPAATFDGFQEAFNHLYPPLQRIEHGVAAIQIDVAAIRKGVEEMDRKLSTPVRKQAWMWAAGALAAVALGFAWFLQSSSSAVAEAPAPAKNKLEVHGQVKQETGKQSPAIANTQTGDITIRYGVPSDDKDAAKGKK